jgi:hypothetical protein
MEGLAPELGPTIDDLVEIARQGGEAGATRRTIRYWRSQGFVLSPGRVGRDWRYPLAALGQVDTVARWRQQNVETDLLRFTLYIETATIAAAGGLALARALLLPWEAGIERASAELRADPEALRREAGTAARMRGRAPLPHRVRGVSLDERTLAMMYALAQMFSVPISPEETVQGAHQLERVLGLRSGRGGAERDLSDIALKPERAEFARRGVEYAVAWLPAMVPTFTHVFGPALVPFLDVIDERAEKLTRGLRPALRRIPQQRAQPR